MVRPAAFKTEEGLRRYQAAYNKTLAAWGVPVRQADVETSFGSTHLVEAGTGDGPPLILLHGATFSATSWLRNVAALATDRRVIALDTIGDVNLCRSTRRVRNLDDLVAWLMEVLDARSIDTCALAGHSYGGWVAAAAAYRHPERVSHLVLLAPAAVFVPFRLGFYLHSLRLLTARTPERAEAFLKFFFIEEALEAEAVRPWREQYGQGLPYWRGLLTPPKGPFRDDELRAIAAPTLLVEGQLERIHDAAKAITRATALIPSISTVLLEKSRHSAGIERPDQVNRLIREHLGR